MIANIGPVSYTHLDVYKRQVKSMSDESWSNNAVKLDFNCMKEKGMMEGRGTYTVRWRLKRNEDCNEVTRTTEASGKHDVTLHQIHYTNTPRLGKVRVYLASVEMTLIVDIIKLKGSPSVRRLVITSNIVGLRFNLSPRGSFSEPQSDVVNKYDGSYLNNT